MSIAQSIKASTARSSMIRKMFDEGLVLKKKYGVHRVFDFSLGNPNVEPPRLFKEELIRLAKKNIVMKHGYTPNAGYPETREAIAGKIKRTTGLNISAEHLVMSCGAGGGLNVVLKALLDPGDEVIVLKPFLLNTLFTSTIMAALFDMLTLSRIFLWILTRWGKPSLKNKSNHH